MVTERKTEDQLAAMLDRAAQLTPPGSAWTHQTSGEKYVVHGHAVDEETCMPLVIYGKPESAVRWSRTVGAFYGRFDRVQVLA